VLQQYTTVAIKGFKITIKMKNVRFSPTSVNFNFIPFIIRKRI